ncbi:DUF1275 family protein [Breoghania sp. JC706]|uniref:YoaK family protein n=1 Tax=Breoghania sp. JC706 TaxID=3117732 RepID=UPI003009DF1D
MTRSRLALLLSFNAGYVDTLGFLALAGLFTAHVTGNFVTLGAALVFGTQGVVAKLLALPVFCVVVAAMHLSEQRLKWAVGSRVRLMLALKLGLFCAAAVFAIAHGPFADGDSLPAIAIGMVLVTAMAIQNTLHKVHLAALPPTTLMTGTTTQIMLDIADLVAGPADDEARRTIVARLRRMGMSLAGFAIGCACGALGFVFADPWGFLVPPAVIVLGLLCEAGTAEAA